LNNLFGLGGDAGIVGHYGEAVAHQPLCNRAADAARGAGNEAGLPEAFCQSFVPPDNALPERFAIDSRVARSARSRTGICVGRNGLVMS
jgi:hypothetical protein